MFTDTFSKNAYESNLKASKCFFLKSNHRKHFYNNSEQKLSNCAEVHNAKTRTECQICAPLRFVLILYMKECFIKREFLFTTVRVSLMSLGSIDFVAISFLSKRVSRTSYLSVQIQLFDSKYVVDASWRLHVISNLSWTS